MAYTPGKDVSMICEAFFEVYINIIFFQHTIFIVNTEDEVKLILAIITFFSKACNKYNTEIYTTLMNP